MDTNDANTLQAAAEVASQNWQGCDDVELTWRIAHPYGESRVPDQVDLVEGVEGVDGGFWVDARVFVADDQVYASRRVPLDEEVNRSPDAITEAEAICLVANAVNQLAMMMEDAEYARTTGLRTNSSEFIVKQHCLRQIKERLLPLIERS